MGVAALAVFGALMIAVWPPTMAGQQVSELSRGETTTAKGTIVSIDKANRLVTLRGPKGNDVVVQADETVQRFNDLKIGDVVTMTYSEAIAMSVRKPGAPAPEAKTESTVRQADKIAAATARQQTVTVVVQAIDLTTSSVSVKGPQGNTRSFRVRDKTSLKGLKVGDTVDITYSEALLVRVDPAK
jgi:Cu/Ag efflux protein CusF